MTSSRVPAPHRSLHSGIGAGSPPVIIACSHDASLQLIMPRYNELETFLGTQASIRLLTYHRHVHELQSLSVADLVVSWRDDDVPAEDQAGVIREEVQPVCSPGYLTAHEPILQGHPRHWGRLRLLELSPNLGWATWDDWFARAGRPESAPPFESYDTYTQTLEAAAAGRGVALGWRHCIESYVDRGSLVLLHGDFVPFRGCYVARLTSNGRRHPLARRCLKFFQSFA